MRRRAPFWTLTTAQQLAREGKIWLSKTRVLALFETDDLAAAAVLSAIANLTADNFAATVLLTETEETCDVYGLTVHGAGWYLKFTIDADLLILSFHPLVRPLRVNKGWIHP